MDNVVDEKLKEIMDHNTETCVVCKATLKRKQKQIRQAIMFVTALVSWSIIIAFRLIYIDYCNEKFTDFNHCVRLIVHTMIHSPHLIIRGLGGILALSIIWISIKFISRRKRNNG